MTNLLHQLLNKRHLFVFSALLSSVLFSLLLVDHPVFAAKAMVEKAALQGLTTRQGFLKSSISLDEYASIKSIISSGEAFEDDSIPLPSGANYTSIEDETLTYQELLAGWSGFGSSQSFEGIYGDASIFGHSAPGRASGSSKISDFLTNYVGYKANGSTSGGNLRCVSFGYALFYSKERNGARVYYDSSTNSRTDQAAVSLTTNEVCADVDASGRVSNVEIEIGNPHGEDDIAKGLKSVFRPSQNGDDAIFSSSTHSSYTDPSSGEPYGTKIETKGKTWDSLVKALEGSLPEKRTMDCVLFTGCPAGYKFKGYYYIKPPNTSSLPLNSNTTLSKLDNISDVVIKNLYDGGDIKVSEQEKLKLYSYYLTDIYKVSPDCGLTEESGKESIKWFKDGETTVSTCYIDYGQNSGRARQDGRTVDGEDDTVVNGVDADGYFQKGSLDYAGLIKYFKELDIETIEEPLDSADESGSEDEEEPSCMDFSGPLGWVICPLIDGSSAFIKYAYESIIEPMLKLDTRLFQTEDNGTYAAWSVLRNLSNIIFIIIFLVVIFSQLTGAGIDNYGIKKILPKLIVGAILVNLSFIVCQLAVDISNILGSGIGGLFSAIKQQVEVSADWVTGEEASAFAEIATHIASAAFWGAMGVAVAFAVPLTVLGALISVAIAVITMFAILGIRQALAVLLIAVSPLAFICYILPSTKPIFDKWVKLLQGVFLAYPLCSALIYGGDFAATVLISNAGSDALALLISALIISAAPIFLLPMLLRQSMGAIGSLAGKLQGVASKKATGAFAKSGFAADLTRRRDERRAGIKIVKNKEGKEEVRRTRRGKLQDRFALTSGLRRRINMRRDAAARNAAAVRLGDLTGEESAKRAGNVFAGALSSRDEQDVNDFMASVRRGQVDGVKASDFGSLGQALEDSLLAADNGDETAVVASKAYLNLLSSSSSGREAAENAIKGAQGRGASAKSIVSISEHALSSSYAGDYKEHTPTMYKFFTDAQSNGNIKLSDQAYAAPDFTDLSPAAMTKLDNSQLDKIIANKSRYAISGQDKQIGAFAQSARSNPQLSGNITGKNSSRIAAIEGWNPPPPSP